MLAQTAVTLQMNTVVAIFCAFLIAIFCAFVISTYNPSITQGFRQQENTFDYNKDARMFVCPSGHMAIRKARQGKKENGKSQTDTYYFDVEKCKTCALINRCYKPGAKTKSYSVAIKSDEHQEQMKFQQTDYFKEKAKHRYKIEAKNSELKKWTWIRKSQFVRNLQYANAGCNGHFYCEPEKNPQVNELIVAPNPNTLKYPKNFPKTPYIEHPKALLI